GAGAGGAGGRWPRRAPRRAAAGGGRRGPRPPVVAARGARRGPVGGWRPPARPAGLRGRAGRARRAGAGAARAALRRGWPGRRGDRRRRRRGRAPGRAARPGGRRRGGGALAGGQRHRRRRGGWAVPLRRPPPSPPVPGHRGRGPGAHELVRALTAPGDGMGPGRRGPVPWPAMPRSFWVETLGCPKNQVDSDKLTGTMLAEGMAPADAPERADLVVVNTCAFIEEARQESIDTVLALSERTRPGARLVVTGCMAERYGDELADALPEVDAVAGFGVPVTLGPTRRGPVPAMDLLELPRPPASAPWAYVKVAEGCDRACGFCAIPSFRGRQRSRPMDAVLAEVESLAAGGVREVVLVAQDLAAYGRDQGRGERRIVSLVEEVARRVDRVRLLYLYPSDVTPALVEAVCATGVPYFDLSLQHASGRLLRRMRRWGDGERFLRRIAEIRERAPEAALRSSFIVGYPGETEDDHDELLRLLA